MHKAVVVFSFSALVLIAGCDLHLTEREAWECLKSERLRFHDPDSIGVTANLGSRGQAASADTFWIRYKAKNGFGAFGQANMACSKTSEGWRRDRLAESIAIEKVYGRRLQGSIDLLKSGQKSDSSAESTRRAAEEEVLEAPENLRW